MAIKTKIICFANNKGGSGKSTTCSSVGYAMAQAGKKVLLVDCDGQMNLTLSCFGEAEALELSGGEQNLSAAVRRHLPAEAVTAKTPYEGLWMIPASPALSRIEEELTGAAERAFVLRDFLSGIKEAGVYHYILIDAPPTLGLWVMNIMCASDRLVIPVEASPWGLFGLANMLEFYAKAKAEAAGLKLLGIVVTKADERKKYFHQTVDTLRDLPDVHLFSTVIHSDSRVEWAQENSQPVIAYAKNSRAAKEYIQLTKEIMKYAGR